MTTHITRMKSKLEREKAKEKRHDENTLSWNTEKGKMREKRREEKWE